MGNTPIMFQCPAERRARNLAHSFPRLYDPPGRGDHVITLTGATKRNPSRRRSVRTSADSRQWKCSCGEAGWSTHKDLERRFGG